MDGTETTGRLKVLQKLSDYEFGVEIWAMRSGPTRNNWTYENIEQYADTFYGVPILCAYTNRGDRIGDGHNMEIRRDPKTGEKYYSFLDGHAERIVGTVSDEPGDIELREEGNETWIVAKGRIFAFYAKELVDKIIETGTMSVSVETEIFEHHKGDDGWEYFDRWSGTAITILGDGVAPAIPGANIAALAAMQEEFTELKLRAASLRDGVEPEPEKKINSDKGVRKSMNQFNKTQIAALADKFTGWIVVCAAKDDEGIHVILRNEGMEFARYTMNSEADTFAPERVEKCALAADCGNGMTVDVGELVLDMTAGPRAENETLKANNATLDSQLNAANETIKTLRANENTRRVADAKRTAMDTLTAFNANREEKVAASVLDAVNADIDSGIYTNSVNADGEWTGAEEVTRAVKALCADAVQAQDKANAERNKRSFIWEATRNNSENEDDGSLASALARYNID